MASIAYDSELMTNYIAALAVPPSTRYVTCLDPTSRRPMVFSISSDGRLLAIKEDKDGQTSLIDMGPFLGIPSSTTVQAFDCQQALDLSLYLCVATRADADTSNVLIAKPFTMSSTPSITLMSGGSIGTVQRLFMGPPDAGRPSYPIILATHQPLDRIGTGSEIDRIMVNEAQTDWYTLRDMQLPLNAFQVIDIAPATNAYGKGLYALVTVQGTTQIIGEFARPDTDQDDGSLLWYNVSLACPAGATSIATVTDGFGRSTLLVSCSAGLQHFTCWEATNRGYPGRLLSSHALFQGAQRIEVAQDGSSFTVWTISRQQAFGYQAMTVGTIPTVVGKPTTLLPAGYASGFSATTSSSFPSFGSSVRFQSIITNDVSGNLSLWQQFSDTGIWQQQQFYVASPLNNIAMPTYTITLTARNSTRGIVSNGTITITTTSFVNAICNGKPKMLSPSSTDLTLDRNGELAFIVPTDSLSSQTFIVTNLRDESGADLSLWTTYIDPSRKALQAFSGIKTGIDLANAKTKQGTSLWDGQTKPDNDTLNKAASAIYNLYLATQDTGRDGKVYHEPPPPSFGDLLLDGLSQVVGLSDPVKDWALDQVGGIVRLACTIAGEVKSFILDTVEKICSAMSWVWDKLKLGIDKLIEFCGWLFMWEDIKNTKRTFKSLLNGTLTYFSNQAANVDLDSKIDGFFEPIIRKATTRNVIPPQDIRAADHGQNASGGELANSTKVKWTNERLQNGGATTSARVNGLSNSPLTEADTIFNGLGTLIRSTEAMMSQLGNDVVALFEDPNVSLADVLSNISSGILASAIDALKTLCKAVTTIFSKIIDWIKTTGNATIDIPILSPLYKLITGDDLSLFDAVCFIIAIPATVITKVITGSAPPSLPEINDNFCATYFWHAQSFAQPAPQAAPQARAQTQAAGGSFAKSLTAESAGTQPTDPPPPKDASVEVKLGTLVKGLTNSVSVLVPLCATFNMLYAGYTARIHNDRNVTLGMMADAFPPMRAIRLIALTCRAVATIGSFVSGDSSLPGREFRYAAAAISGIRVLVGINTFLAMSGTAEGFFNRMRATVDEVNESNGDPEKVYQVVCGVQGICNLTLYSMVYDLEFSSSTASWKDFSVERSALGVADCTLGFVGNMGNRIAYATIQADADPRFTVAAMAVADVADIAGTTCKLAHWVLQYNAGIYPSLTESGGGE